MTEPDKYSNASNSKQFQGINFALNQCFAECDDARKAVKELHERVGRVVAEVKEDQAEIGRQKDEIAKLEESMKKARVAFGELKKGT
jgi:uncharacterized coiled-coil DUF342 family protein